MQQLHKRLHPSRPVPRGEDEMSHLSFLEYLEKTGGLKHAREPGLILWLLGHAIDAAAVEDIWWRSGWHYLPLRSSKVFKTEETGRWLSYCLLLQIHHWWCFRIGRMWSVHLTSRSRTWYRPAGRQRCSLMWRNSKFWQTKSRRILPQSKLPRLHLQIRSRQRRSSPGSPKGRR